MDNLFQYLLNRNPSATEREKYRNYDFKLINQKILLLPEYTVFLNQNYQKIFQILNVIYAISLLDLMEGLQPKTKQILYHKLRDNKYSFKFLQNYMLDLKNRFDKLLRQKCRNFYVPLTKSYPKFSKVYLTYLNLLLEKEERLEIIVEKCWEQFTWDMDFINFVDNYTDKYLCY